MSQRLKNFKLAAKGLVATSANGVGRPLNEVLQTIRSGNFEGSSSKKLSPHQRLKIDEQSAAELNSALRRHIDVGRPQAAIKILEALKNYPVIVINLEPDLIQNALELFSKTLASVDLRQARYLSLDFRDIAEALATTPKSSRHQKAFRLAFASFPDAFREQILTDAEEDNSRAAFRLLKEGACRAAAAQGSSAAPTP